MKVTSFEISKKLAEIGFKAECSYLWFEKDQAIKVGDWIHPINEIEKINKEAISYIPETSKNYPAYDLETIIDALPNYFANQPLVIHKKGMFYRESRLEVARKENEFLADTAARLLIQLYDAGIVKFKE